MHDLGTYTLGLDAARVLAAFALVSVALAVTGLWEPCTYGAFKLVMNTVGMSGWWPGARD